MKKKKSGKISVLRCHLVLSENLKNSIEVMEAMTNKKTVPKKVTSLAGQLKSELASMLTRIDALIPKEVA